MLSVALCLLAASGASADTVYTSANSGDPNTDDGPKPLSTSYWNWTDDVGDFQVGSATGKVDERRLEAFATSSQCLPGNAYGTTATSEINIPIHMDSDGYISFRLNAVGGGSGSGRFLGLWEVDFELSSDEMGPCGTPPALRWPWATRPTFTKR